MLRLPQTSPKEMSGRHLFPELKVASEGLKQRVFDAHLQYDEDNAYRKIRLRAEHVQGRNVLTQFWVGQDQVSPPWMAALYEGEFYFGLVIQRCLGISPNLQGQVLQSL